jgi:hypothetical protein
MMFSGQPFSQFAFSEQDYAPIESDAFEAFLAEVTAKRCWLLELDAFSLAPAGGVAGAYGSDAYGELAFGEDSGEAAASVSTLRYSTHGYTSHAADAPASTWYDSRLTGDIIVRRLIAGRDGIGGLAKVFAEVTLINADGGLDGLTDKFALSGRRARLLLGRLGDPLSEFGLVFAGVVQSFTIGERLVHVRLSDGKAKLDRAVNEATYAGTGGLEGGEDLAGKRKPIGWGAVFNISPPLVDSAGLVYQVHAGAIQDVTAVYDRGVALVKVVGAPGAGEYQVDAVAGTFKLGATPAGTVTCDAELDASGAGYVSKASEIVLRVLAIAGLDSSEIEPSSFVQLGSDSLAPVGIWIGTEPRSCAEVCDELLAGIGAFGGFSRYGFNVGLVGLAAGKAKGSFSSEDIVELERLPLPAPVEPIIWRALVGYQRNYTVQTDLAAAVPAARRTYAAEPHRIAQIDDVAVQGRHLLARELGPTESHYAAEADADAEARRLFDLWGKPRGLFRVKTRPKALLRDLGQVIDLQHPRHGLAHGAPARVLGHEIKGSDVELTVLV